MNNNIENTVEITIQGDADTVDTCVNLLEQNHIQHRKRVEWKADEIIDWKWHHSKYYVYSFTAKDVEKAIAVMNPSGAKLYVTLLTPTNDYIKIRCNEYDHVENLIDYVIESDTKCLTVELM